MSCTSYSYHELLVSAGHVYIESRVMALKYGSIIEPYFRAITLVAFLGAFQQAFGNLQIDIYQRCQGMFCDGATLISGGGDDIL